VFGVLNVIRAALPTLKKQKSGHILNFSSVGGRLALAGIGLYSASKYAVEGLSEALAIELKPLGIKVTIVEPGAFDTDFAYRSLVHANVMPEYEFLHENRKTYMANVVFGDPATGMQAVLKLVDMPEPPLHFTIGPNSMTRILQKLNTDIAEYESYKDIWEASTANSKKK
jgi:short-subunit dehydrogenase